MAEPRHFFVHHSSGHGMRNWLMYLWLLPLVAGVALIGIFFFVAFVALFSVVVVVIAARFWWLRRKLHRRGTRPAKAERSRSNALEGEYVVISENNEDTHKK